MAERKKTPASSRPADSPAGPHGEDDGARPDAELPETAVAYLLTMVIPTRNERENARLLVERLADALKDVPSETIVVDDSDDDTPQLFPELAAEKGISLRVLHRPPADRRGGLSTAVLAGLREAQGEYVAVMDADLQHPPELLPAMLDKARSSEADIVIASRYVKGGSDEGLSSTARKVISLASRALVKALFYNRLRTVSDPLSGFFVVRRELVNGTRLQATGFKVLLDILVRTPWSRADAVALRFQRRGGGSSKATLSQGRDFLVHTARLFWQVRLRFISGPGR